jgi:hypothetical protein
MRSPRVLAVLVSLFCPLSASACVQGREPSPPTDAARSSIAAGNDETEPPPDDAEQTGEARQEAFSAAVFRFVTIVRDDGEGKAGGWQEASPKLKFSDWRHPFVPRFWACRITIGVPLRAEVYGTISPAQAAAVTAAIATDASSEVMHEREEWLPSEYCFALADRMQTMFRARYLRMGARVHL